VVVGAAVAGPAEPREGRVELGCVREVELGVGVVEVDARRLEGVRLAPRPTTRATAPSHAETREEVSEELFRSPLARARSREGGATVELSNRADHPGLRASGWRFPAAQSEGGVAAAAVVVAFAFAFAFAFAVALARVGVGFLFCARRSLRAPRAPG
jgi:hypothetical protein